MPFTLATRAECTERVATHAIRRAGGPEPLTRTSVGDGTPISWMTSEANREPDTDVEALTDETMAHAERRTKGCSW